MQIETSRLIIRDFVLEDWASVHLYASDVAVTEYMIWGPNSEDDTKGYLEQIISMQQQNPRKDYEFAVTLKESGLLIGGCGIHVDEYNGEIGYCFNPNFWGQGYASEAALAMLSYGFKDLRLNRIYATCRPKNIRSSEVMKRVGMKQEGHLREHMWHKGNFHDSYLFSILQKEFSNKI